MVQNLVVRLWKKIRLQEVYSNTSDFFFFFCFNSTNNKNKVLKQVLAFCTTASHSPLSGIEYGFI